MNKMKWVVLPVSIIVIFSSCASMSNTDKGTTIGGGSGAASDAVFDGIIGKGKGATINVAIGTAVGAGASALIGKKMGKATAEAKQIKGVRVEQIIDNNRLQAAKVTFDSSIFSTTGNATLNAIAKSALNEFANNVLNQNRDIDVSIYGYIDNQGQRNSTVERSRQKNLNLSQERARSVANYLLNYNVSSNQTKGMQGMGGGDPIANNNIAVGREQNRRVEVYMCASEQVIKDAQAVSN